MYISIEQGYTNEDHVKNHQYLQRYDRYGSASLRYYDIQMREMRSKQERYLTSEGKNLPKLMRMTLMLPTLHSRYCSSSIFHSEYDATRKPRRLPGGYFLGFELGDALKQLDAALSSFVDATGKSQCQSELASESKGYTLEINTVLVGNIAVPEEERLQVYTTVVYMKVISDPSTTWSRRCLVEAPFKLRSGRNHTIVQCQSWSDKSFSPKYLVSSKRNASRD